MFARERLARMICADTNTFSGEDARLAAESVLSTQSECLESSLRRVAERLPTAPQSIITSGAGEFLTRRLCDHCWPAASTISLAKQIGVEASRCAPAHALAVLAREMFE